MEYYYSLQNTSTLSKINTKNWKDFCFQNGCVSEPWNTEKIFNKWARATMQLNKIFKVKKQTMVVKKETAYQL